MAAVKISPTYTIFCKLSFPGFHRWKDAPQQYAYLREWHRHIFHVTAIARVERSRMIEFIDLKNQISAYCRAAYENKQFELSCEEIALDILDTFKLHEVTVSEDNENGATVNRQYA